MRDPRQLLVALVDKAGRLIDTICDSGLPVHTYPEDVEDAIIEFCWYVFRHIPLGPFTHAELAN